MVLVEPMDPFMFGQGGLLLQAFVVGLLLLLLAHGIAGSAGRFLGWAPFAYLGVRSYGIYLYHWPITLWLDQAFPGTPLWVAVPVVLGLMIALLTAYFVKRSLDPRLRDVEAALQALHEAQGARGSSGDTPEPPADLLDRDPHARYRRPGAQ